MTTVKIKGKYPLFFGWLKWPVNVNVTPASSWNELSQKELYVVADILHSKTLLVDGKMRLMVALLGIKFRVLLAFTASQVHDLLPITKFILEENKLTTNLIPFLTLGSTTLYGPNNFLANINIEEFAFADAFYVRFKETKSDEMLCRLCATLYRPKREGYDPKSPDFKGDIRQDFNKHQVFNRARRFEKFNSAQKYAISLFYEGCREKLIKKHPNVFSKGKGRSKSFGWGGILMELAGDKFGDLQHTNRALMVNVLSYLEMQAIKAKKLEAEYKKLKRKHAKR